MATTSTEQLNELAGLPARSRCRHQQRGLSFWLLGGPPVCGTGDEHVGERSRRRARAGGLRRMVSRRLSVSAGRGCRGRVPEDIRVTTDRRVVERIPVLPDQLRAWLPVHTYPISAGVKGGIAGSVAMAVLACAYGVLKAGSIWYPSISSPR